MHMYDLFAGLAYPGWNVDSRRFVNAFFRTGDGACSEHKPAPVGAIRARTGYYVPCEIAFGETNE